ncbi:MAG: DUF465 domain-containing protein [Pseudomonadota bacterium]
MSLTTHIQELQKKHQSLSAQVEELRRHPSATDQELYSLKKQKLHLKEQIERLSRA